MLWHKAWMDTRWRFLTGVLVLLLSAMGTVFSFQLVAGRALSIGAVPQDGGLVSQAIREAVDLARTFRGFVWLNAFSQNLTQLGVLFAVMLGSGGLRTEAAGTLYTLSLPFSRGALMSTRAATGLLELVALTMLPPLAIVALAPAVGERYPVVEALVHGMCLFAGTAVFFSLTFWLSTLFSDPWRPGLIAFGVATVIGLCESLLFRSVAWGLFHLTSAESYFRGAGVPWLGLLVVGAVSAALLQRAIVAVERQDY
jgi:hypothetical protein